MATVYRARHISRPGDVALKIAHGKPFQFDALFREADCLAQLNHPNVVKILPLGTSEAQKDAYAHKIHLMGEPLAYLALEWIEGQSLKDELSRRAGPLPVEQAAHIAARLAEALAYTHSRHVIHLDIKPANIMLDRISGEPVLMDFGIARRLDKPPLRISEKNLGTAGYMAPEHINSKGGQADRMDARTDVFSLGVVIYELITGTFGGPFKRPHTEQTLEATVSQDVPPPSHYRPELAAWDGVVQRCLAKRPEDRFQSMAEVQGALRRIARRVQAPRGNAPKGHSLVILIAALCVLLALGLTMWGLWCEDSPTGQQPLTIVGTVIAKGETLASQILNAGSHAVTTPTPGMALPGEQKLDPTKELPTATLTRRPTSTLQPAPAPTGTRSSP
jgi:serine/threonine protein kinase